MTVKRDASSLARLAPDFLELRAPSTSITTGPVPNLSYAIFVPSLDFTVATITSLLSLPLACCCFRRSSPKRPSVQSSWFVHSNLHVHVDDLMQCVAKLIRVSLA